jgi:hypothetical protein
MADGVPESFSWGGVADSDIRRAFEDASEDARESLSALDVSNAIYNHSLPCAQPHVDRRHPPRGGAAVLPTCCSWPAGSTSCERTSQPCSQVLQGGSWWAKT